MAAFSFLPFDHVPINRFRRSASLFDTRTCYVSQYNLGAVCLLLLAAASASFAGVQSRPLLSFHAAAAASAEAQRNERTLMMAHGEDTRSLFRKRQKQRANHYRSDLASNFSPSLYNFLNLNLNDFLRTSHLTAARAFNSNANAAKGMEG